MKVQERIDKTQLLDLYRQMRLLRAFEEECSRQYMMQKIRGFLHLYIGEEAIAVGAISALRPEDYVVTHYRDHGQALARGLESKVVMAELFGKETGCSKGKGGSMHLFDVSKNFMGGYAIVGGQLPIATGLALSVSYNEENRVVLCFLGDGALNEGEFHESMNLASIWKLPVIFFCENNLYGMGAAASATVAIHEEIYKLADAYRMPGRQIDGMDVLEVREKTLDAVEHVRNGEGPIFLEALTYRFRGHSIADPAGYRSREELEYWMQRDPLLLFRQKMLGLEVASEPELVEIEELVDREVVEAVKYADESPFPPPSALHENVYAPST